MIEATQSTNIIENIQTNACPAYDNDEYYLKKQYQKVLSPDIV